MNAEIITIGDELLIGQVLNTNASVMAKMLNAIGIEVTRMTTVGDDGKTMLRSFEKALQENELTIVTGGLGPTHDDITKTILCDFFATDLVRSEEVIEDIKALMQQRNLTWSSATETQALVPRSARIIRNHRGTAPGLMFEKDNHYLIAMPGVPFEMEAMMQEFVLPYFSSKAQGKVILHRTLNTTGIGEAVLFEKLGNLNELLGDVKLAFLPSPGGVRLRLTVHESSRTNAEKKLIDAEENIRVKANEYIYGTDSETIADNVGSLLTELKLTIAIAESCTGGFVANLITNISGSSAYFERGIVTYSNQSKVELLDVPKNLIATHGAVSREVAEAMALGVRTHSGTDIGISTTGIAGPTGGSTEKPIGLVFIGYSDHNQTVAFKFQFADDRIRFKERASQAALNILRKKLLNR